jgi:anti-sigma B factor antagonist
MFNTIRQAVDDVLNETEPGLVTQGAAAATGSLRAAASDVVTVGRTPAGGEPVSARAAETPASAESTPASSAAAPPVATSPAGSPHSAGIADINRMGNTIVATLTELELCGDAGAAKLDDMLDTLHQSGCTNFILDLVNVRLIDSCCLGTMVQTANRLAAEGGKIALVNPAHSVEQLFRLTRLDRVFTIHKDVMTALQALERKAEQ